MDENESTPQNKQQQNFFIEDAYILCYNEKEEEKKKIILDLSKKCKISLPKNIKYEIKLDVYDSFGIEKGITVKENIKTVTTVQNTNYVLNEEFKSMEKKIITIPKRDSIHKIASQTLVTIEIFDTKRNEELFKFEFEYD